GRRRSTPTGVRTPSAQRSGGGRRAGGRVAAPAGVPPALPVLGPRATHRSSRPPEDRRRARGPAGVAATAPPPAPAAGSPDRFAAAGALRCSPRRRCGEAGAPSPLRFGAAEPGASIGRPPRSPTAAPPAPPPPPSPLPSR